MRPQLKIFSLSLILVWAIAIFFVFLSGVQESPILVSRLTKNIQVAFIPQGWAFFTKSCRDPVVSVFQIIGDSALAEIQTTQNRENPISSFNRIDRVQMLEISAILEQVDSGEWRVCGEEVTLCKTPQSLKEANVVTILNKAINPTMCDDLFLTVVDTVPWSWAELTSREKMPGKAVRLHVKCQKGKENV